jgi:hypothetical protein
MNNPNTPDLGQLGEAIMIVEKHVALARTNVSACRDWSPAQAEWSRARDLGLNILDDLRALKDASHDRDH